MEEAEKMARKNESHGIDTVLFFDEVFNDYNPAFLLALYDVKRLPLIF